MSAHPLLPEEQFLPLESIDRHFADFVLGLPGVASAELWAGAALASQATHLGHICADLAAVSREFSGKRIPSKAGPVECPRLDEWLSRLRASGAVGEPGALKPLILVETAGSARLYLYRYWRYERALADFLRIKAAERCEGLDQQLLAAGLSRLFPEVRSGEPDWQQVAAAVALHRKLAVITGGPGTGKTSTVVRILALLLEQAQGQRLRIALTAPTAKAASRIKDAVEAERNRLPCAPQILAQLPAEAATLHRLLGFRPESTRFRHGLENRLPLDVLVVDEVSMVDLPMMVKTVQALPGEARLILLGDRDQLASVEPGRVFADICGEARRTVFSRPFSRELGPLLGGELPDPAGPDPLPALADSIVVLERNYRFGSASGIGALSRQVNAGDSRGAWDLLLSGAHDDIAWQELPAAGPALERAIEDRIREGYAALFQADTLERCFEALARFRILCAVTRGSTGVEAVNELAAGIHRKVLGVPAGRRWHRGQPVLITANDYAIRLFNGDVGVIYPGSPGAAAGEGLQAHFSTGKGLFRTVLPQRLPEHLPVYATTVHRSQGSEYQSVVLILPDRPSPVVTRELLYTAMTRARRRVEIWGRQELFRKAVETCIERSSGLQSLIHDTCRAPAK